MRQVFASDGSNLSRALAESEAALAVATSTEFHILAQTDGTDNQAILVLLDWEKAFDRITREGLSLDKLANKYEVQPLNLTNYHEIEELRQTLPQSILTSKISVKQFINEIQNKYTK